MKLIIFRRGECVSEDHYTKLSDMIKELEDDNEVIGDIIGIDNGYVIYLDGITYKDDTLYKFGVE